MSRNTRLRLDDLTQEPHWTRNGWRKPGRLALDVPETRPNISGLLITRSLAEPSGYAPGESDPEGRILRTSARHLRQLPNGEVVSCIREVWYRDATARLTMNEYARWRAANARTEESLARRRLQARAKQRPELVAPEHSDLLASRRERSSLRSASSIREITPKTRKLGQRGAQSRPWLFDPEFRPAWLVFLRTREDVEQIQQLASAALSRWYNSLPAGHRIAPRRFDPSQKDPAKMWPACYGVDPAPTQPKSPDVTPELVTALLCLGIPSRSFSSNLSLFAAMLKVPELKPWADVQGMVGVAACVSRWIAGGQILGRQIPGAAPGSFSWYIQRARTDVQPAQTPPNTPAMAR